MRIFFTFLLTFTAVIFLGSGLSPYVLAQEVTPEPTIEVTPTSEPTLVPTVVPTETPVPLAIPVLISPICGSLTNQSAVTPQWNSVSGVDVVYVVERTSPSGEVILDSAAFNMNIDGVWKWRVKAVAGLQDSGYSEYCDVTYDITPPVAPGVPETLSPTRSFVQGWYWMPAIDVLSGIKNYSWSVSDGSSGTTTGNTLVTFLTQGTWYVNITANDNAGNQSSTVTGTLVVDRLAPEVSANNSATTWFTTNPEITLYVKDLGDAQVYVSKYSWDSMATYENGTDFVDGQVINIPNDGEHTLYLYAMDNNGNTGSWSGVYKLDTADPVISSSNSSSLWTNSLSSIVVNATDLASGLSFVKYAWNSPAVNGTLVSNGTDLQSTLVEGDNVLNLYAEDFAGRSITVSAQYRIDNSNPISSVSSPVYVNTGTIPLAHVSSDSLSGVSNVDLWYRFNGGTWNNYGVSSSFDPIGVNGTYEFYSIATDIVGNTETKATADDTTVFDNIKPTGIWIAPVGGATVTGNVNLEVSASDNLSGIASITYKYALDSSTNFIIISGSSWDTSSLAAGTYKLRATIIDNAGNQIDVDEVVQVQQSQQNDYDRTRLRKWLLMLLRLWRRYDD